MLVYRILCTQTGNPQNAGPKFCNCSKCIVSAWRWRPDVDFNNLAKTWRFLQQQRLCSCHHNTLITSGSRLKSTPKMAVQAVQWLQVMSGVQSFCVQSTECIVSVVVLTQICISFIAKQLPMAGRPPAPIRITNNVFPGNILETIESTPKAIYDSMHDTMQWLMWLAERRPIRKW